MLNFGVFSEEENNFIIENYEFMTQKEIGLHLNRKEASVKDRIKKLGLNKVPKKFWTDIELETLKHVWHRENDYMAYFPDRTYSSVMHKAWELGLKRDGRGNYDVDHDYFKTMDEVRAYIVGFIAADGNIYSKRSRLTITQHGSDRYLLDRIKYEMKSERPIFKRENGVHDFVITSREIVKDLIGIGLTDNKSLTLKRLKIPKEYMSHFVRGYFDGDGCVSVSLDKRRGKKYIEASLLGTEEFLSWISQKMTELANLPRRNINSTKSKVYKIKYSGKNALKFAAWMYQDSSIFLNRKKETFSSYEVDTNSF